MDYTQQLDNIEENTGYISANTQNLLNEVSMTNNLLEEIRDITISGDMQIINDNIIKVNNSVTLIAIALVTLLIYNFIVRSLK